jgi:hypothetical protein
MIKLVVFGKTAILLASGRVISELFAKRASAFSDRPSLVFSGELCGLNDLHPMTQFGQEFRQQRKLMKEVLGADVIRRQEALLDEKGRRMLQSTFADLKGFDRNLRRFVHPRSTYSPFPSDSLLSYMVSKLWKSTTRISSLRRKCQCSSANTQSSQDGL